MPKFVDHSSRREEISGIVAGLIAQGGMDAATIREIARSSGYSKGVIEHYFENKDELISAALDWTNNCYQHRVAADTDGLSGLSALRKRIEATLPIDEAIRGEWKVRMVFWSMAATQRNLQQRQARRFNTAVEVFADDIDAAIDVGDIASGCDTRALAHGLFTATIGLSTVALYNPTQYHKARLLVEIEQLLQGLVAASMSW